VSQPILCMRGSLSLPLYEESVQLLQSWLPQTETHLVQNVNHLLLMQDAGSVGAGMAQFLMRHSLGPEGGDDSLSLFSRRPAGAGLTQFRAARRIPRVARSRGLPDLVFAREAAAAGGTTCT